jgi:hypothetical protein
LLISALVSVAVERQAMDSLQVVLASNRVPAEDLKALKISDQVSYRAMFKRAFRSEEALRLASFEQVGTGRCSLAQIGGDGGERSGFTDWFIVAPLYRVFLLGDDLAASNRFTAEFDAAVRRPYWQAKDRMQEYEQQLRDNPGGILTGLLMPAQSRVMENATEGEARRGTARLGLALYGYRARNGRFPANLDELVPEFIAAVPPDPFDGKPLKLKRTDHGLTVYSIGRDMADNGGARIDNEKTTGDITFVLSETETAEK